MNDYTGVRIRRIEPDTSDVLYKYAQGGNSLLVPGGKPCWRVEGFGRPHVPGFHEIYMTRHEARIRAKALRAAWK